jgi:hypothetical protein
MEENEINGYYDDDGNKINLDLIKTPGLCLVCIKYEESDPEEVMLCNLNRLDHHLRKEENFECATFLDKNK